MVLSVVKNDKDLMILMVKKETSKKGISSFFKNKQLCLRRASPVVAFSDGSYDKMCWLEFCLKLNFQKKLRSSKAAEELKDLMLLMAVLLLKRASN